MTAFGLWRRIFPAFVAVASLLATTSTAWAGPTLEAVRARGVLLCGVSLQDHGFSAMDERGNWHGFDTDLCRAVAAAVLGDTERVKFITISPQTRFHALIAGEVDILMRTTAVTLARDASLGVDFTGVTYYDSQGFMVRKDAGLDKLAALQNARICVESGTSAAYNLEDYERRIGQGLRKMSFESQDEAKIAFFTGRCDAYSDGLSLLAAMRATHAINPDNFIILPEPISKEPRSPVVRDDDAGWADIVTWTVNALILAEEKGVTAANAAARRSDPDREVQRLLGGFPGMGISLGLDETWAFRMIRDLGNYGEIFDRNLTRPFGIQRGHNALWTQGGLMYPPPFQ